MKELYQVFLDSLGVSIDTRNIKGGELFFCLKGERFNGNKFARQALTQGASFVVVDDPYYYQPGEQRMLLVDDSLKQLQALAKYHRECLDIPVIGITGTNGKTTTKELVAAVLSSHLKCLSTQGNFNNHIGVPLTLLRISQQHEIAVIEMGANHSGEIADLCQLSQPNYGIITNIGRAHLEGFGSYNNIINTKTALYKAVKSNEGLVFVNADDKLLLEKAEGISKLSYGSSDEADVPVKMLENDAYLKLKWSNKEIQTQLFGQYNFSNVAVAIAVGVYFDIPEQKIITALENYTPSNNRSQLEKGEHNELILDAYNANPDSLKQAIIYFNQSKANQKIAILGDMLELGDFEEEEHRKILDMIGTMGFDKVYLVGQAFAKFRSQFRSFTFFENNMEALAYFKKEGVRDARILLKGSRGIKLEVLKEVLL